MVDRCQFAHNVGLDVLTEGDVGHRGAGVAGTLVLLGLEGFWLGALLAHGGSACEG